MRNQAHEPSHASGRSVLAYDLETIAPAAPDGGFPPWPTHNIVAAGFAKAWHVGGQWTFELDAMVSGSDGEAGLVREANAKMSGAEVITGYNSRQFDALVLRLAAQRCRLWDLKALADHAAVPRFNGEHADLADLYASFGRKVSLAQVFDEVGIPVKTSVTGADVAALWAAGETERVRDYVLEDAVATLCLWFCWSASRVGDEALVTRPLAALARHIDRTPALAHLQAFVDCSLVRWARPRALKADIAAALGRVQIRLGREEDEKTFALSDPGSATRR